MNKLNDVKFIRAVQDQRGLGESRAEVAFVGRSNVGKSSILNAVCGRKNMAFTSRVPGKTRVINVFAVGKAHGYWIVDLPGYGFAVGSAEERGKWPEMIEGYLNGRETLRRVYLIVDAFVGPTRLDHQMALWLQANRLPFRVIANKIDKVRAPEQDARRLAVAHELGCSPEDIFWVSASKNTGIRELQLDIAAELEDAR